MARRPTLYFCSAPTVRSPERRRAAPRPPNRVEGASGMLRSVRAATLILLLAFTIGFGVSRASVATAPVHAAAVWLEELPPSQVTSPNSSSVSRALTPLQQAYRLLLDRYV